MPQGVRHGPKTRVTPTPTPPSAPYTGVQAYQVSDDTRGTNNTYPAMKLISEFISWKDVERSDGVYTWPTNLDLSIADAHTDGYEIMLRISGGKDSPESSRTDDTLPGWMASFVPYVTTLQNERNPTSAYDIPILIPIPWDAQHLFYFTRFIAAVGAFLAGPCPSDSTHPRSTHVYLIPGFMPTENGTEMAFGYGQVAQTWLESTGGAPPKLAANWTASSPAPGQTFTLTGDVSAIPQPGAGQYVMLRIGGTLSNNANLAPYASGTELVLLSSFNRTTKVGTIAPNGRGWSGTAAQGHTAGSQNVYYADDTTSSGTLASPVTINGVTGIWDHQSFNRGVWDSTGVNETNRRTKIGDAWISQTYAMLDNLPASVLVGLAGSSIMRDNMVQANRVLDTIHTARPTLTSRLCVHTTKLAVDPAGVPGTRSYHDWLPTEAAWMDKGASYGYTVGFQTGGLSELTTADLSDATESALEEYPHIRWVETNFGSRVNSQSITIATRSGAVATFTSNGHGLAVGNWVKVTGMTPSGYNGTWQITAKTTNTFTVTLSADPGGSGTAFGKWTQAYVYPARGTWPGGTLPMADYLLTAANNFQSRLPTT